MLRQWVVLRWAGVACLVLAALAGSVLAWPSSREHIEISLSGDQMQPAWVKSGSTAGAPDVYPVPSLLLSIDVPRAVLLARQEDIRLAVNVPSETAGTAVYSVGARVVSADGDVVPFGESGQALRGGAAFEWTLVAKRAPLTLATLLVRLRRHSNDGATEAERLVLARDLALPVRTVAGLSAPVARLAAAVLGLSGALLGIASGFIRTR
jgi:hypothetical protein